MTTGVAQIVRFNWPFYAIAGMSAIVLIPTVGRVPMPAAGHVFIYAALACAILWIVTSLTTSWIVYDVSSLMRWNWIARALGFTPRCWINIHASLDQSTPALQAMFGSSCGRVFDIFDLAQMTEPSIARARRLARNVVDAEPVDFRHLPAASESTDAVLLLLSAHELRTDESRVAFFREVHRILTAGGRAIVAEHLRDWPNFCAFGPGFLHFHSRRTWIRSFARAALSIASEFSITPFVRVFVLARSV
jgi:SAM-dependent methyltransferase